MARKIIFGKVNLFIILYLFIGLFIGCYYYQSHYDAKSFYSTETVGLESFYTGIGWPAYLIIRVGLFATEWAIPQREIPHANH